jgi:hypothetical protein
MSTPATWSDADEIARLAEFTKIREIRGAWIPENPPPSCPCCGTMLCDHGYPLDKYCPRCSL